MVYTMENFEEMFKTKANKQKFECDEEVYYYFLEVLPPIYMRGAEFGFAEGREPVTRFWQEDGKFYGQETDRINPHA